MHHRVPASSPSMPSVLPQLTSATRHFHQPWELRVLGGGPGREGGAAGRQVGERVSRGTQARRRAGTRLDAMLSPEPPLEQRADELASLLQALGRRNIVHLWRRGGATEAVGGKLGAVGRRARRRLAPLALAPAPGQRPIQRPPAIAGAPLPAALRLCRRGATTAPAPGLRAARAGCLRHSQLADACARASGRSETRSERRGRRERQAEAGGDSGGLSAAAGRDGRPTPACAACARRLHLVPPPLKAVCAGLRC